MVSTNAMARVRIAPLDRLRVPIGGTDVSHQLSAQVGGGEDATSDDVPLHILEPEFDSIEPGGVRRCEVQPYVGMQPKNSSTRWVLWVARLSRLSMDLAS